VKKLLTVFIAVLVIGLVFSETVNIEFWHGMGGAQGETLSALVDSFNKENPDIQVDAIYVGGYGDLNRKLLSTITAAKEGSTNDLPTITQAYGNWIAKYLYSDVIEPLNSYIENDPQMKRVWDEEIYQVFKEGSTWGDTIYSIPFNKSVYVYYYNTDLFDLYGVTPPETMDEFMEITKYLTEDLDGDGNTDQYGLGARTFIDDFQTFLFAYNGEILEYVGDGKYRISLDRETTKKALSDIAELRDGGYASFGTSYLNDPFGSGEIAAYMGTIAGKSYVARSSQGKHGWTWAALPSVDGIPHSPIAGTDITMFNWSTGAQKDAAYRFIKYLLDPVNMAFSGINTGYLPVRRDVAETKQWQEYVASDEKAVIAQETLETAIADPKPAAWNDIRNEISTIFANFVSEQITADEFYDRTVNACETLLAENDELAK
jgi:multiple sugar transport system substrate-binding protein